MSLVAQRCPLGNLIVTFVVQTNVRRGGTALLLVALLGVACGPSDTGLGLDESGDPVAYSTGASDLVLRIETLPGGPLSFPEPETPLFSLYGDGRVVELEAAAPEASAVPRLSSSRVTEDALLEILDAAREAGLLQGLDTGDPRIPDAGGLAVTLVVDGRRGVTTIIHPGDLTPEEEESLTTDQLSARQTVESFLGAIFDLEGWLGADVRREGPYEPDRVAVFAVQPEVAVDEEGPDPQVLPWPLGDLAELGDPVADWPVIRCLVVSGADLDAVLDAAREAHRETRWETGSGPYLVWFRPLLPDEEGCHDLDLEPWRNAVP